MCIRDRSKSRSRVERRNTFFCLAPALCGKVYSNSFIGVFYGFSYNYLSIFSVSCKRKCSGAEHPGITFLPKPEPERVILLFHFETGGRMLYTLEEIYFSLGINFLLLAYSFLIASSRTTWSCVNRHPTSNQISTLPEPQGSRTIRIWWTTAR